MDIGTCILKNNIEYICVDKKTFCEKDYYQFLGYLPKVKDNCRFDVFTTDKVDNLMTIKCPKFVKFENLYQHIFDLINYKKAKLVGIAFDYGDDWYDSETEDELAQYIFLCCHSRIIQIAIPTGIEFTDENYNIPYVYINEIFKDGLYEIKKHSRYYLFDEDLDIEKLNEDNASSFFNSRSEYLIGRYKISKAVGIRINNFLVADFDMETIITVGNGLCFEEDILDGKYIFENELVNKVNNIL